MGTRRQTSGEGEPHPRAYRTRRFIDRYDKRRAERQRGEHHALLRPLRVASGLLLILAGIAIGWLPGPGFVILALPGALLVASEIRQMALAMDRMEHETIPRVLRLWARARGGPRDSWVRYNPSIWHDWSSSDAADDAAAASGDERRGSDRSERREH